MSIAYIGLGSNLGERRANIESAIARLRRMEEIQVRRISSLYESEPWGFKNQPHFLNGVLELETSQSPKELQQCLLSIEKEMGRKGGQRWGPRIIDLDLLLFDELVKEESFPGDLVLPHPRMQERKFVLIPLLELDPNAIHPQTKKPFKKILQSLENDKSYCRVEIDLH